MDTDVVRELIELAKCLSFTETARRLNISQSTLSKHIGALEKDIRLVMFDRSTAPLRLTREGSELLPFAFELLEAQRKFQEKAKELRTSAPVPQLFAAGLLNEEMVAETLGLILSRLNTKYGNNFLQVRHCQHKLPRQLLAESAADIIFDYATEEDYADDPNIEGLTLGSYSWLALVGKSHPLAHRESVSLDELHDETFVQIEGTHLSEAWRFIAEACARHGFEPKTVKRYSMRSTDLLSSAANIGDSVLVMGQNFTRRVGFGLAPFCAQIPISDADAFFPVSAICRMDNPNPILEDALQIIRESTQSTSAKSDSDALLSV